jgi:transposase-like protein
MPAQPVSGLDAGDQARPADAAHFDKSGAISRRQSNCWNNAVEQDHRPIKSRTPTLMGISPSGWPPLVATVESMHMIDKGRLRLPARLVLSAALHFRSLVPE